MIVQYPYYCGFVVGRMLGMLSCSGINFSFINKKIIFIS